MYAPISTTVLNLNTQFAPLHKVYSYLKVHLAIKIDSWLVKPRKMTFLLKISVKEAGKLYIVVFSEYNM